MNLVSTLELYSGGPGSGCNPEVGKCGRPIKDSNFANVKNKVLGTNESVSNVNMLMKKYGYELQQQGDHEGTQWLVYKDAKNKLAMKLITDDSGVFKHLFLINRNTNEVIKEQEFTKHGAGKSYQQGSAIATAFSRLKSGEPLSIHEVFAGVETSNPMQVMLRLQRHGEKYGWDLKLEGGKAHLQFSDQISPIPVAEIKQEALGDKTALEVNQMLSKSNATNLMSDHKNLVVQKVAGMIDDWKSSSRPTRTKYIAWMSSGKGTEATKLFINSIANGTTHSKLQRGMDIHGSKYTAFMSWVNEYHKEGKAWDMAASSFSKGSGFSGNIKVVAHDTTGLDIENFDGHKHEREVIVGGRFKIEKIDIDSVAKRTTIHLQQIGKHVAV